MTPVLRHRLAALLLIVAPLSMAEAATVRVVDAETGEPLARAVVEAWHPAPSDGSDEVQNVIQRDATFIPTVSLVSQGASVRFPNRDTTRHHVFSFSPAKTFELELYLQDTPPPIVFDKAGVVVLGCNIHDHMEAFIVVSEASSAVLTGEDGVAELGTLPAGRHRLRVWHPRLEDTHRQWWEGEIEAGADRRVALELRATPPPPGDPSPLQQRFREALENRES